MIYLDYNATAPVHPEVAAVMAEALATPANPSSVHKMGRKAKQQLEDARSIIAEAVSGWANEVIFTASGTEANNMALRGVDMPLLVSATEHASVQQLASRLGGDTLPVDGDGLLALDILEAKLTALGRPALVSVILANNETGVIQPMAQISKIVHAHGGLLHVDAVQALGKIPLDMGMLGADMLTLCAHKMGGPVGVGALIARSDTELKPFMMGGGQELGRRAGTENLPAILGFSKAVKLANDHTQMEIVRGWLENMVDELRQTAPELVIAGEAAPRLPNTVTLCMPGSSNETQLMKLDLQGICVSAGSACSSGRIAPSHVLEAMGLEEHVSRGAIRVSAGWNTTQDEIQAFTNAWKTLYTQAQEKAA